VQHDAPPDDATASRVNHYRQPTAAESAEPIPDVTPATALHAAPVFYPNALLGPLDFSRHLNAAHPNLVSNAKLLSYPEHPYILPLFFLENQ
jgi:hypothetical protein